MDAATVNALISGGAGLFGATIGGLTTYFSGAGQHKRQVRKERQDLQRDREHNAAKECEALCVQMADDMEKARHPAAKPDDADIEREERVDATYRKFAPAALYLPTGLRQRIEVIGSIIQSADDLSYGSPMNGFSHYHTPYTICWHARREIRVIVAAFVKDEPISEPSRFIVEYLAALDDLNKDREEYYSLHDEDDPQGKARQRRREDFYKRHPELRRDEAGSE